MLSSPEISVQETAALLETETAPVLIDCREQHEFDYCRIKGAVLVPLSDFAGKAETLLHHAEQSAIVYCHHGVRSLHATHYLHQQGFTKVLSMQGGIDAWSRLIDPSISTY